MDSSRFPLGKGLPKELGGEKNTHWMLSLALEGRTQSGMTKAKLSSKAWLRTVRCEFRRCQWLGNPSLGFSAGPDSSISVTTKPFCNTLTKLEVELGCEQALQKRCTPWGWRGLSS